MNEYNHHRIIERFAANVKGLSDSDVQVLKDASNFTDDFIGSSRKREAFATELRFFYYHFYYDIICEDGTIVLQRSNSGDYRYDNSMSKCDYDKSKYEKQKLDYRKNALDSPISNSIMQRQHKLFFSTINNRESYLQNCFIDNSNQSDCVAFLHAMGAKDEEPKDSYDIFREHLRKCFSEYLFVKTRKEALFMLGVAFHGIMDSFTPSHTGFQQYVNQDMAMHAQGDVVPVKGVYGEKNNEFHIGTEHDPEEVEYDPGQINHENKLVKCLIFPAVKGYNSNEKINETEYLMLRIFFLISEITDNSTNFNYAQNWSRLDDFWKTFEKNTLSQINDILKSISTGSPQSPRYRYKYGDNAYVFSETAINVITEIYNLLAKERQKSLNDYNHYKEIKNNPNEAIENSLVIWEKYYKEFHKTNKKKIQYLETLFKHKVFGDKLIDGDIIIHGIDEGVNNMSKSIVNGVNTVQENFASGVNTVLENSGKQQMNLKYGGLNKI